MRPHDHGSHLLQEGGCPQHRRKQEGRAAIERVDGWRKTYRRSNKALQAHSLAKRMDAEEADAEEADADAEEADEGRSMEEMESVL